MLPHHGRRKKRLADAGRSAEARIAGRTSKMQHLLMSKREDGCNLTLMERQRIQDPRRWAKRARDASCGGLHGARVYLRPWSDRRSRSTHLNHERQWHYQRLSCRVGGLGTLVVGTPLRGGLSPDNTVTVPPKCGSEQKGAGKLQGKFEFRMAVWGSLYS